MISQEQLVKRHVDSIVRPVTSGTGMGYICKRDGQKYFVKVRSGSLDQQQYGVWKEYVVCSHHPTPTYATTAEFVAETDNHVAVGFEHIEHDFTGNQIYTNREFYDVFLDDLFEFLHTLHGVSVEDPRVAALRGNTYFVNDRLTDGQTHFFEDAIASRPYFTGREFDAHEPLLKYAQRELSDAYTQDDAVPIHDALSNPENILCTQNGIEVVADWEYFDWFDRLHELAAVETLFIDEMSWYYDDLTIDEARSMFRDEFNIAGDETRRLTLYKAWFNYFQLQYYADRDKPIPGNRTPSAVASFYREQLNTIADQYL